MFVENVERLARERNMSLSGVANALGMTNNSAAKWRKGSIPNSKNLYKIAEYFGVTVDYLLADHPKQSIGVLGNVTGHNVVSGVNGSNVSLDARTGSAGGDLDEQEKELLRIFRSLDMRGKTALLSAAYVQEELKKER